MQSFFFISELYKLTYKYLWEPMQQEESFYKNDCGFG